MRGAYRIKQGMLQHNLHEQLDKIRADFSNLKSVPCADTKEEDIRVQHSCRLLQNKHFALRGVSTFVRQPVKEPTFTIKKVISKDIEIKKALEAAGWGDVHEISNLLDEGETSSTREPLKHLDVNKSALEAAGWGDVSEDFWEEEEVENRTVNPFLPSSNSRVPSSAQVPQLVHNSISERQDRYQNNYSIPVERQDHYQNSNSSERPPPLELYRVDYSKDNVSEVSMKDRIAQPLKAKELTEIEDKLQRDTSKSFDWDKVYCINKQYFGYGHFRPGQRSAIHATCTGQDAFIIMPTGGGKSLCYQVPALCDNKVSIVVSPLVSLIQDQVTALVNCGVNALAFTGSMETDEYCKVLSELRNGAVRLLYVTPEKIAQSRMFIDELTKLYRMNKLDRFVIDEAHCVSQWGHDFRNDYLRLGNLRKTFSNIPIVALTATASTAVMEDVVKLLGLRSPKILKLSFNRPNLHYFVHQKKSHKNAMLEIIKYIRSGNRRRQSGIIYCLSRKDTETVAAELQKELGDVVTFYHANVEPEEKRRRQERWSTGRISVIVATIAFGMGIDKPDVRYVIHYSLPKTITNFYQESGRAGRDGGIAECHVYYMYSDKVKLERMIKQETPGLSSNDRKLHGQLLSLSRMMHFCLNEVDCRRKLILEYFGENYDEKGCNRTCDNCCKSGPRHEFDATDIAKSALSVLRDNPSKNTTLNQLAGILKGSLVKGIKDTSSRHFGLCESLKKDDILKILYQMSMEFVVEDFELSTGANNMYHAVYIKPGVRAEELLGGNLKIIIRTKDAHPSGAQKRQLVEGFSTQDMHVPTTQQKRPRPLKSPVVIDNSPPVVSFSQFAYETVVDRCPTEFVHHLLGNLVIKRLDCVRLSGSKVKPWHIFGDETLDKIARSLPMTLTQLSQVEGVAASKLDVYGSQFLDVVHNFVETNGIDMSKLPPF